MNLGVGLDSGSLSCLNNERKVWPKLAGKWHAYSYQTSYTIDNVGDQLNFDILLPLLVWVGFWLRLLRVEGDLVFFCNTQDTQEEKTRQSRTIYQNFINGIASRMSQQYTVGVSVSAWCASGGKGTSLPIFLTRAFHRLLPP